MFKLDPKENVKNKSWEDSGVKHKIIILINPEENLKKCEQVPIAPIAYGTLVRIVSLN
jgi:hypothetical protein